MEFYVLLLERMRGFDKMNFRNAFWKNRIIIKFDIVSYFFEARSQCFFLALETEILEFIIEWIWRIYKVEFLGEWKTYVLLLERMKGMYDFLFWKIRIIVEFDIVK